MNKTIDGVDRVIDLTMTMLKKAHNGDFEALIEFEKQRDVLLHHLCEHRQAVFRSDRAFQEFVHKIMELDTHLMELVHQEQRKLSEQLSQLQSRRQAAAHYQSQAGYKGT